MNFFDGSRSAANAFVEQQRNEALVRELALMQAEITRKLTDFSDQSPDEFENCGGMIEEGRIWFPANGTISGLSDVDIVIAHFLSGNEELKAKIGVDTATLLHIGLYTDRESWEAYKKLNEFDWEDRLGLTLDQVKERLAGEFTEDEVDDMTFPGAATFLGDNGTYSFVDNFGNCARVVGIPRELANGRVDLAIEGSPLSETATVLAPMTPRDLFRTKEALEVINCRIDRVFPPQINTL